MVVPEVVVLEVVVILGASEETEVVEAVAIRVAIVVEVVAIQAAVIVAEEAMEGTAVAEAVAVTMQEEDVGLQGHSIIRMSSLICSNRFS